MTHMTAEDLYDEIKDAIDYLGVRFHDKASVHVVLVGERLVFRHGGRECSVALVVPPPAATKSPA